MWKAQQLVFSRREFLFAATAPIVLRRSTHAWSLPEQRGFKSFETVWVPMKDATRIAMRLWLPDGADRSPVPVVMEYDPYGQKGSNDPNETADALASYGFAFARPDIRGTGDSEGVMLGEYLQQEQDDGVEIIAWLAKQPWCNGCVGLRGVSWSGIAALQLAAMAPPALKAIMPHCATDNRYTDDAHYVGGALSRDNVAWGNLFEAILSLPPDPAVVGDRWRDMWLQRLKAASPLVTEWTRHQRYDAFWQHGSVQVDYARIRCPVYAVDGQVDAYRDFIPRLLSNLSVPRKGLMGSWGHGYPNEANPGPGLAWTTEEVRWWAQWLKGENTGVMDGPMLRVYLQSQTASEVWPKDVPGHWVAEDRWPSSRIGFRTFFLNGDGLEPRKGRPSIRQCESRETVGLTKPAWLPFNMRQGLPRDQTPDDKRSVTFDSTPLARDIDILGNVLARIRLSSDQPVAKIAVRLNELTPDGKSWNVTYGLLNLTHRNGHERPEPLEAGHEYDVDVSCYFTAHRFKKGNRIRVAITESLWPIVWPSPRPVVLRIVTGSSRLMLPVRPPNASELAPQIPMILNRMEKEKAQAAPSISQQSPDAEGRVTLRSSEWPGNDWSASIKDGDPNSGVWKWQQRFNSKQGDVEVTVDVSCEVTSTPEEFRIKESRRAMEGDKIVVDQQWDHAIQRDLM